MSIVFQEFLGYQFNILMNFFILDGYGQFVWPAFIFTFVSCFYLYLKTKRELQKQEELFLNEFKQVQTIKIEVDKRKETRKKILSGSSI
tara:strand:+ start:224 stop:490 length:267 start_codon:yes stop_codon:yes gene_type:complete